MFGVWWFVIVVVWGGLFGGCGGVGGCLGYGVLTCCGWCLGCMDLGVGGYTGGFGWWGCLVVAGRMLWLLVGGWCGLWVLFAVIIVLNAVCAVGVMRLRLVLLD